MYYNTQEEIITKITKSLEESLILRKKVIKNLGFYKNTYLDSTHMRKKCQLKLLN